MEEKPKVVVRNDDFWIIEINIRIKIGNDFETILQDNNENLETSLNHHKMI